MSSERIISFERAVARLAEKREQRVENEESSFICSQPVLCEISAKLSKFNPIIAEDNASPADRNAAIRAAVDQGAITWREL